MPDESEDFKFPKRLKRGNRPQPDRPVRGNVPRMMPKGVDIWSSDAKPDFVPNSLVSVLDAFERIGKAKFGDEWTGFEGAFRGNQPAFPHPNIVFKGDSDLVADPVAYRKGRPIVLSLLRSDTHERHNIPLTNAQWRKATDLWQMYETHGGSLLSRREAVTDHIHRALADGDLVAVICDENGRLRSILKEAWNCHRKKVWLRLRTASMTDAPPAAEPFFARKVWFFDGKRLEAFVGHGHASTFGKSENNKPFGPFSTWEDIRSWYIQRVSDAPVTGYTRPQDEAAGREVGIGRDRVRELRREFAPSNWSKDGPRKK